MKKCLLYKIINSDNFGHLSKGESYKFLKNLFAHPLNRFLWLPNIFLLLWNKNRYIISESIFRNSIKFYLRFIVFRSSRRPSNRSKTNKSCVRKVWSTWFVQTNFLGLSKISLLLSNKNYYNISELIFGMSNKFWI